LEAIRGGVLDCEVRIVNELFDVRGIVNPAGAASSKNQVVVDRTGLVCRQPGRTRFDQVRLKLGICQIGGRQRIVWNGLAAREPTLVVQCDAQLLNAGLHLRLGPAHIEAIFRRKMAALRLARADARVEGVIPDVGVRHLRHVAAKAARGDIVVGRVLIRLAVVLITADPREHVRLRP
jgi:hypothetical protein